MKVKKPLQFKAFYLFFIISSAQIGVGILDAPRHIFKEAHQDSWLSILIIISYSIIIVFVMFFILNQYENADIYSIQVDIFGKWIGKLLGTIYVFYFTTVILSILVKYIHTVQLFLYPTIHSAVVSLFLLVLVVYSVNGGIRAIIGVVFIFFLITPWIIILLYDPVTRIEITHFQPMFQASFKELLKGAKEATYTFLGFELLFVIYPYIENKHKAKLPTYLGLFFSGLIVLMFTIIAIGYYSPQDFEKMIWSVLRLFKSISFPLLERFDYVVVTEWMMIVIPTMILFMWAITHGIKRMYAVKQKTTLYTVAILLFIISSSSRNEIVSETICNFVAKIGFWLVFVYPLILLPIILIKKGWNKRKGREQI